MRISFSGAALVVVVLAVIVGGGVSGAIPVLHTWWHDFLVEIHQ